MRYITLYLCYRQGGCTFCKFPGTAIPRIPNLKTKILKLIKF